eukprot:Hpha_TRINITY_DN72_c0_g1::TRINITY_DN72_c0_g1_i1::g.110184::m.110184/K06632/WEE1; wee1-like protein kinase
MAAEAENPQTPSLVAKPGGDPPLDHAMGLGSPLHSPYTPELRPSDPPPGHTPARWERDLPEHAQPPTPAKRVTHVRRFKEPQNSSSRAQRPPPVSGPKRSAFTQKSGGIGGREPSPSVAAARPPSLPPAHFDPQGIDMPPRAGSSPAPRMHTGVSPAPRLGHACARKQRSGSSATTPGRYTPAGHDPPSGPNAPLATRRRLCVGSLSQEGDIGRSPAGAGIESTPTSSPPEMPRVRGTLAASPLLPQPSVASSSDLVFGLVPSPVITPAPASTAWPGQTRRSQDFVEQGEVGRGHFGRVRRVTHRLDRRVYALKVVEAQSLEGAEKEARALSSCVGCPHVVRYYACWFEERRLHLLTEFCDEGALSDRLIFEGRHPWEEGRAAVLALQMLLALQHLHEELRLAHLDVKPDNIYLSRLTPMPTYKLGDFGHAAWLDRGADPATPAGLRAPLTPAGGVHACSVSDSRSSGLSFEEGDIRYLPLDMLNEKSAPREADIFALGMTLYEVVSGRTLPKNDAAWQQLRSCPADTIRSGLRGSQASPLFHQFLTPMLSHVPPLRPRALTMLVAAGGPPEENWIAAVARRDKRTNVQLHCSSCVLSLRNLAREDVGIVPAP